MAAEHSSFAPFYLVSYKKKPSGTRSVSYLSQWMLYWVDLKKAIRGRIRGEYYIRGEIREQFERIANSIEADATVIKVGDEETAYLNKILAKQGISIPTTIASEERREGNEATQLAFPKDLHEKIAGINDAIQRIETQIQAGDGVKQVSTNLPDCEQNKSHGANREEWQVVLEGFQLYRDIFETGMKNSQTKIGLFAALDDVVQRQGLTPEEGTKKMDKALRIAEDFAGAG